MKSSFRWAIGRAFLIGSWPRRAQRLAGGLSSSGTGAATAYMEDGARADESQRRGWNATAACLNLHSPDDA